jgi:hypothetical protein
VPDWNNLNITEIYIQLNPYTQAEKLHQRGWQKKVVDCNGKPLHSVGVVGNRLLKKLVTKKLIPNIPLNIQLPPRKGDRLSQLEYLRTMINDNVNQLSFVRKFLCDNIMVPINCDVQAENPSHINVNLQARIIMLANDPSSCAILEDIHAAPDKVARRPHIDDPRLSNNEKWNTLVNCFINASDFSPCNDWEKMDSRIETVDPRAPPSTPWTGEDLRLKFRLLKQNLH